MLHRFKTGVLAAVLALPLWLAAQIGAEWVPAEADYVISFDLARLQKLAQLSAMQNSVDEGIAATALQKRLNLSPEVAVSALFTGGGRQLRALLLETTLTEKQVTQKLMRQPGVRVENRCGRLFYLLPPPGDRKPLNQPVAISQLKPGLLLITFEKYAVPYLEALARGKHPAFQAELPLAKCPVWVLVELQKISAEEVRKKGRKAADGNAFLKIGRSVYRIWGGYELKGEDPETGSFSVEAVCRDAKVARQSQMPLQMLAAMGINFILPEDPATAAKITDRMEPRISGSSCIIGIRLDRALWQRFSGALVKQYQNDPAVMDQVPPPLREKIQKRK